jgi:hypothetical protein
VARDGLEEPLVSDYGAVRMVGWHDWELEERSRPPVKHLNVHGVDLLQLLRQNSVVVRVQDLRESQDKIAAEGAGDISRLESGKRSPELVNARLSRGSGKADDDLRGLRTLSDA